MWLHLGRVGERRLLALMLLLLLLLPPLLVYGAGKIRCAFYTRSVGRVRSNVHTAGG
jgi:hypothetical protein